MRLTLFCLALLVTLPLAAEPFVLASPAMGAAEAPNDIMIGAADHGFLLAGTSSHHPIAIPLSGRGTPEIVGDNTLGLPSASAVDEPKWVDGRWIVLIDADHNLPNRLALAEVDEEGELVGDVHKLEWPQFWSGTLASNGRSLLVAGSTSRTTTIHKDLAVRVIADDLGSAGPIIPIAEAIGQFALAGTADGFLLGWANDAGVWLQHLDDAGIPDDAALQIGTSDFLRQFRLAVNGEQALLSWAEASDDEWTTGGESTFTIRTARWSMDSGLEPPQTLSEMTGSSFPQVFVEPLEGGFVIVWQPVDYGQGRRLGREIVVQEIDSNGTAGEPYLVPNLIGEELVTAIATRQGETLISYTRHFAAVGTPLKGTIVRDRSATVPELLAIRPASIDHLETASAGDSALWGAWVESTAQGSSLNVARWDSSGEQRLRATLLDLPARLGSLDIATNGVDTILTWHQGYAIFAAPLTADGLFAREPFYVALGDGPQIPNAPAIAWDGERFVIAFRGPDGIEAAHVVPQGVQRTFGTVATAPEPTASSGFAPRGFELAAEDGTIAIVADIEERQSCTGIPCHIMRSFIGTVVTDGETPQPFLLGPPGDAVRIATNGSGFMVSWRGIDGMRAAPLDRAGQLGSSQLVFRWPQTWASFLDADGDGYVLTFSYFTSSWHRIGVVRLDAAGRRIGTSRGLDIPRFPGDLRITHTGPTTLLSWIGAPREAPLSPRIWGAVAAEIEENPPAPPEPAIARATRLDQHRALLSWTPVPEADEYVVQQYRLDYFGQNYEWFNVGRTTDTSIESPLPPLRVMALGKGGASEPVVVDRWTRLRLVRRP